MSSLCLSALLALALALPSRGAVDVATGIEFPNRITDKDFPGVGDGTLAGTGVRVKKIGPVAVKVYAVGLYVDQRAVQSSLNRCAPRSATATRLSL